MDVVDVRILDQMSPLPASWQSTTNEEEQELIVHLLVHALGHTSGHRFTWNGQRHLSAEELLLEVEHLEEFIIHLWGHALWESLGELADAWVGDLVEERLLLFLLIVFHQIFYRVLLEETLGAKVLL